MNRQMFAKMGFSWTVAIAISATTLAGVGHALYEEACIAYNVGAMWTVDGRVTVDSMFPDWWTLEQDWAISFDCTEGIENSCWVCWAVWAETSDSEDGLVWTPVLFVHNSKIINDICGTHKQENMTYREDFNSGATPNQNAVKLTYKYDSFGGQDCPNEMDGNLGLWQNVPGKTYIWARD